MSNITTKSGALLVIAPTTMKNALKLKNAVEREVGKSKIKIDIKALKEGGIEDFIELFANVDSSEEVQNALFDCLLDCTYNTKKITESLFDEDVKTREDYYEIIFNCAKVNLTPFFGNLFSMFSTMMAKQEEHQKQK